MYDNSISSDETILSAKFTQAIVYFREEMKHYKFMRQLYPTFTSEGGRELHIKYIWESVTLFTDEEHQLKLPTETDYYLSWFVANNSIYTPFKMYRLGYWSFDSDLIENYKSYPIYLPPHSYSITRPLDRVLDEISKRIYHHALVKTGQLTFKEAAGAVGAVCDDLGINSPFASKYYDEYNLVKASPRRISSYQKKVKKNKI